MASLRMGAFREWLDDRRFDGIVNLPTVILQWPHEYIGPTFRPSAGIEGRLNNREEIPISRPENGSGAKLRRSAEPDSTSDRRAIDGIKVGDKARSVLGYDLLWPPGQSDVAEAAEQARGMLLDAPDKAAAEVPMVRDGRSLQQA
jgi:hypothetical protein